MSYETIMLTKENNIATITLNRPDKLNSVTLQMVEELTSALDDVSADKDIRVLLVTGAGRAFCSGFDVSMMMGVADDLIVLPGENSIDLVMLKFRDMVKPSIAAVNGLASGMGFSIAMSCDMRIASDASRFSQIFVKRGLIPDTGSTYFLPRLVGIAKACEMVFTGDFVDAQEAARLGIVNRVVPADEMMTSAMELATKIANGPPITIQLAKRALYRGLETDLDVQLEYEMYQQSICMKTEDFQEGVNSFLEKREAHFKGK